MCCLYRKFLLRILLLYLALISHRLQAQNDTLDTEALVQDSVKLPYRFISQKDTLYTGADTIVIARDLIIREKLIKTTAVQKMIGGNDTLYLPFDTTLIVMDTMVARVDTIRTRNERILHKVEEFSKKRNIFSRLLRNIVVFEKKKAMDISSAGVSTQTEDRPYKSYDGKVIRDIEVRVLDAFGRSINDPEKKPVSLLEKGGNVLHIKSQRWIIRNKLLFSRNERVNPLKISESERLLRQTNFIYDARIIVKELPGKDSVDVLVIAQDVWSISAGAGYNTVSHSPDVSLRDVNFLGLGQQIGGSLKLDNNLPKGYNYSWNYTLNNIYRTLISASFFNAFQNGQTLTSAGLGRDFVSPAIKWAGGLGFSFNRLISQRYGADSILITEPLNYNQQDLWLGYAARLFNQNEDRFKGNRLITSARFIHTTYFQRPLITDSSGYRFFNSSFYLGSIGFVNRRYYKDNYIFRFGRTEDIPAGSMLAFTAGVENREVGKRPYFGMTSAWSRYSNKYGYFYTGAGAGGFYEQGWKQAVIYNRTIYFTPLLELGNWGWRNFIGLRYTHGFSRLPGDEININKANGIRGINLPLSGNQKIVMNYETNFFPPVNLIGFRMAFVLFTDLAWIADGGKLIDKNNFYPGYGLGLRFRNDHLIFNTIQILFGYYPNVARLGKTPYQFFDAQKTFYNFNDFQLSRPELAPYF